METEEALICIFPMEIRAMWSVSMGQRSKYRDITAVNKDDVFNGLGEISDMLQKFILLC